MLDQFLFEDSFSDANAAVGLGVVAQATANGVASATTTPSVALGVVTPGEPGYTGIVTEASMEVAVQLASDEGGLVSRASLEVATTVVGSGVVAAFWLEVAVHIPPRSLTGSVAGDYMARGIRIQGGRLEKGRGNLP